MRKPKPISRPKSNAMYKKGASKVHKKNTPVRTPMRGGIRL